jgi:FtsH-binding integral membrane protein
MKPTRTFLLYVLLIVIIQLCVTYYVMNRTHNPDTNIALIFILSIITIIILTTFHENIPPTFQFALFTFFSYLFGLLFYQVKQREQYPIELINEVIISTISVFASMAIIGSVLLSFGIKLGFKVWLILFVGLLSLIISRLILIFTTATQENIVKLTTRHKLLSTLGIFLFSGYVIYDTNIILQGTYYNKNEHIRAALSYYLDFINIFSNKLSLTD